MLIRRRDRTRVLLAAALLVPGSVTGQQQADAGMDAEALKSAGERLGRCAGVYGVFAAVDERQGKSASAEVARGKQRGAQLAAQWMFAMRHAQQPNTLPKPLGHFKTRVESYTETGAALFAAALEQDDRVTVKATIDECASLLPLQQSVIDAVRDSSDQN